MNTTTTIISTSLPTGNGETEFVSALLPHVIILGLYFLVGLVGNSIVIHIYLSKMRESTDSRFFIPSLAIADILACTVCVTSAIVMSVYFTNFTNDASCRFTWFLMTSMTSGAAMILVFIAYHRYMKICKLSKHSSFMDRKVLIVVLLYVLSFVVSSPILLISGVTKLEISGKIYHTCDRIRGEYRTDMKYNIAMVYTGFEALIVISIATLMTVLYTKVGSKLYKHFKMTSRIMSNRRVMNVIEEHSRDSIASINSQLSVDIEDNKPSDSSKESASPKQYKRKKDKFNRKHKYTYIFISISVICIITYTPRLILMIIESIQDNFWTSFLEDSTLLPFFKFLNRFYIVNNIANPFLYAMFDPKFKYYLFNILKCGRHKTVSISS